MPTKHYLSKVTHTIIGCAIEVHKHLGPGLLESLYHECVEQEILDAGLRVESQTRVPVTYKGRMLRGKLQLDLLIEDCIVVELKAVEYVIPLYRAQLLSYLKLTGKPKGLLLNFHCDNIVSQMVSLVTPDYARLPNE